MSVEIKLTTVSPNLNAVVNVPTDNSKKYPVLVFFVGKGEFGSNAALLYSHGPAKFLQTGYNPQNLIIACVQNDYYWTGAGVDKVNKVLDELIAKYPSIDPANIFATGLSAGCANWYQYMFTSQANANRLKGIVLESAQPPSNGLPGQNVYPSTPTFQINAGTKGWGICGTADSFYVKQKQFFALLPGSVWTDFVGAGHDGSVWDVSYNPNWVSPQTNGNIYDWVVANASVVTPPVYQSAEYSENFTKNDCPCGQSGSTETFTAEAGAYQSSISQADADQKAIDFVKSAGQAHANGAGTCALPPARLVVTIKVYDDGTTVNTIN